MKIYVVTYENDGDFPDVEIMLATINLDRAIEKAENVTDEFAYGVIKTFKDDTECMSCNYDRSEKEWDYPIVNKLNNSTRKEV